MNTSAIKNKFAWLLSPWTILISIILGSIIGFYFKALAQSLSTFGNLFLDLLEMCVIPLVISAIATSLARLIKHKDAKNYIIKMFIIFIIGLFISSVLGLIVGKVGMVGSKLSSADLHSIGQILNKQNISVDNSSIKNNPQYDIIPSNIVKAIANGESLSIVVFTILFGLALGLVSSHTSHTVIDFLDGIFETFIKLIFGILYILPFGILCIVANNIAVAGLDIFLTLGRLVFFVYLGCILLCLVCVFILKLRLNLPLFKIILHLKEALIIAFITTSSFAALPFILDSFEYRFKVNRDKVNLIVPLSVSINQIGSAFFFSIATIFIAQLYNQSIGIESSFIVVFGAILISLATSGAPMLASFTMMSITLAPLGLPITTTVVLFIIIAQIIDPILTIANVLGHCVAVSLIIDPKTEISADTQRIQHQC